MNTNCESSNRPSTKLQRSSKPQALKLLPRVSVSLWQYRRTFSWRECHTMANRGRIERFVEVLIGSIKCGVRSAEGGVGNAARRGKLTPRSWFRENPVHPVVFSTYSLSRTLLLQTAPPN